jgi:hypothetical protein
MPKAMERSEMAINKNLKGCSTEKKIFCRMIDSRIIFEEREEG